MGARLTHLKTVHTHRKYVRQMCFKMGIPLQGMLHDLSKYSPTEMKIARYANGGKSPHQICREQIGYSPSWMHHYHKNKHHYQYWIDDDEYGQPIPVKMPYKYVIEMFCDMVGAGRAYMKDKWTVTAPMDYYARCCYNQRKQHKNSEGLVVFLFATLIETGSLKMFAKWYKKNKKTIKKVYEKTAKFTAFQTEFESLKAIYKSEQFHVDYVQFLRLIDFTL